MSRVDELIRELCPDGVPYIGIMEVNDYIRGITYNKNDEAADGEVSVLRANNITLSSNTLNFKDLKRVSGLVRVRDNQRLCAGDILICAGSGSKEHIGKVAYIDNDLSGTFGGFMAVIRAKSSNVLAPRFVFHLLAGSMFSSYLRSALSTTTINNLSAGVMRGFRIPVPPLVVQLEIVRVLDLFTQLESELEVELEAELEARRRQYEHYRMALMSATGDARGRVLPLGDIFEMRAGTHITAAEISDEPSVEKPYPCYGGNGLRGYVSSFNQEKNVIFVGRQGALCGNVHRAEGKVYATEHAVVVTPKLPVDMSWAFHMLIEMDLNQYKTKSAQPGLAVGRVKQVEALYPPVRDQHRDGSVLDKLDALVNEISIDLPAELAARRKQFEYYRDKLLTFEEAAELAI